MLNSSSYQSFTVIGEVIEMADDPKLEPSFEVRLLNNDEINVSVVDPTSFEVVTNFNGLAQDRFPALQRNDGESDAKNGVRKYISKPQMVCVQGIYSINEGRIRMDAKREA